MIYLLANFWLWLLLALIVGLIVGWMTFKGRNPHLLRDLWPWALLFLVGALVVILRLMPDRFGLWAELGVLLAASYFIGCIVSYLFRNRQGAGAVAMAGAASGTKLASAAVSARSAASEVAVDPAKEAVAKADEPAREEAITGLSGPRNGKKDDLTKVYGIDAETEAKLNALGIYHFDQIATMTPGQSRWLFSQLGHAGRFPSWWWRWKYDAEQLASGKTPNPAGAPVGAAGVGGAGVGSAGAVGLMDAAAAKPGQAGKPVAAAAAGSTSATGAKSAGTTSGADSTSAAGAGGSGTGKTGSAAPASAATGEKSAAPAAGNLDAGAYEGAKPVGLASPRAGKIDDLKRIRGIGRQNEGRLHALGVWHFDQIAAWTAEESKWVGSYLAFSGRIEREDWKGQAAILAKGGVTEFAARADRGEVKTSLDDTNDDGQGNVAKLDKPVTKPPKA